MSASNLKSICEVHPGDVFQHANTWMLAVEVVDNEGAKYLRSQCYDDAGQITERFVAVKYDWDTKVEMLPPHPDDIVNEDQTAREYVLQYLFNAVEAQQLREDMTLGEVLNALGQPF